MKLENSMSFVQACSISIRQFIFTMKLCFLKEELLPNLEGRSYPHCLQKSIGWLYHL